MKLKKSKVQKMLKKDIRYLPIQEELNSYRKLGITEYIFLGSGCNICNSLNEKSFLIKDAQVGVNLPPMHSNCKCTIVAKTERDLFVDRTGVNPLKNNPKFEEWKRKQIHSDQSPLT